MMIKMLILLRKRIGNITYTNKGALQRTNITRITELAIQMGEIASINSRYTGNKIVGVTWKYKNINKQKNMFEMKYNYERYT